MSAPLGATDEDSFSLSSESQERLDMVPRG
jgi:hypothetical protein